MSPHEMSTERIEEVLEEIRKYLAEGDTFWAFRVEQFEKILKERAEAGTY